MQKVLTILLLLLLFASFDASSQSKFSLSVFGGYSLPLADLQGDFPDTNSSGILNFTKSNTLLTSSGFNIGATGKYAVDTLGKAKVTAGFNYNSFTGSKDYSRPTGTITYKNKVNIFSLSAGLEYNFLPKKKVSPFVGLDLAANFFSGKIDVSGDTSRVINRKSESRFGVIVNAGALMKLSSNIDITAGVKYALTNLIGKKTELTTSIIIADIEEETSSSANELPLNDEETSANRSKSLYYLQFYAGVSINIGELLK
jgi:outer membrane protein W